MVTSISDVESYRGFCKSAVENDLVFDTFRRQPVYGLVEGMGPAMGQCYLDLAYRDFHDLLMENLAEFKKSDSVGGPNIFNYDHVGDFSPATVRYIKIAFEINKMFGSLDGMRIAEIGAGYGGQCRALSVLNKKIASYTIFDLPEPQALARRYLSHFSVPPISFLDVFKTERTEYDLVISNYAFSEIEKSVQDLYLDRVITSSKYGYMIDNSAAFAHKIPGFSYNATEILAKINGAQIISPDSMPQTDAIFQCMLIYWRPTASRDAFSS